MVAVIDTDKDNEILAYAKWEIPSTLVGEVERVDLGPIPNVPQGTNEEVWEMFRAGIDGMRAKWGDEKEDFGTSLLPIAVHLTPLLSCSFAHPLISPSSELQSHIPNLAQHSTRSPRTPPTKVAVRQACC